MASDQARELGLDPLTFRSVALDSGLGANLLQVAPLPRAFSYSQFSTYEKCPLQYAFSHVYRIPTDKTVAAFTFGTTAHEAFEAFTSERRERGARGEPPPTREDLERLFRERWTPTGFGDKTTEEGYERRVQTLLDNFWDGEVKSLGQAIHEEQWFDLTLDPADGSPPVIVSGSIDRIDRLPSGGIEVIDYKTGRVSSQKGVDESLQLSIYALACRDALGLGTPERVTLYFTESATRLSTTRTDEQLDAARDDILARVARMRAGRLRGDAVGSTRAGGATSRACARVVSSEVSMQLTTYQVKYLAWDLTRPTPSDSVEKLASVLADAQVDLNPHQVEAALFAFRSPFSKGAILADEVGLGKTIEAGLLLAQKWAERKRRLLVIVPANLRKQWSQELADKFYLPSVILETRTFNEAIRPAISILSSKMRSYPLLLPVRRTKEPYLRQTPWDLVVIDEAHRLRNVYKNSQQDRHRDQDRPSRHSRRCC